MDYPRLLFVTSSVFNPFSGGGITFTNLFKGWPKDKIATVHGDALLPSFDVCDRYFHLTEKEFAPIFPFSLIPKLQRRFHHGHLAFDTSPAVETRKKLLQTAVQVVRQHILSRIMGDELPVSVNFSPELVSFIEEFRPELVYTILGSLPYMELVDQITRRFQLPAVLHIMDDWPQVLYRRGLIDIFRRPRMKTMITAMMRQAAACLGISPAMCEAYQKRYKRTFLPFHNALESDLWLSEARKNQTPKPLPFVMVYAGALLANSQLESVRDVAAAVSDLAASGMAIEFRIYAPWYAVKQYGHELRGSHVKVFDAPDDNAEMQACFTNADLLLLPVNFDAETVRYVRYSMPTKIPAYMFSGTPTLAYGPESVASIQYAVGEHWAYGVTRRDPKLLREAIRSLADDPKQRARLAARAQKLAQERHNAIKVRQQFHDVLKNAAHKRL